MRYTYNAEVLFDKALIPLYEKLKRKQIVNGTVEIIDAHLTFYAGLETALNLGNKRGPQEGYIENENAWYLSQDRCIKGHEGIEDNKIWRDVCATDDGMVNSNYGWCVFSPENGFKDDYEKDQDKSQYDFALEQLCEKPWGRQSMIFYSRPSMQWEWNDGVHAKSDFTCTVNTQHFVRETLGELYMHYIVNMRSNDVLFGLHAGDLPWHGHVYNKMLEDVNACYLKAGRRKVHPGHIYWNAGSLHIYERHFKLLEELCEDYLAYHKSRENDS